MLARIDERRAARFGQQPLALVEQAELAAQKTSPRLEAVIDVGRSP